MTANGQQIDTAWTRNFGGSGADAFTSPSSMGIFTGQRTKPAINKNNEIFIASFSSSTRSSDVRINYGSDDILVLKLNQNGDTIWSRTLGGNDFDRASGVIALGDGGCIVVGRTASTTFRHQNGSFTFPIVDQNPDLLVFRLSATGTVIWAKTYGTNIADELNGILRTHDKNIVVYGQWGDDACALKLDTATGADIWSQKTKISATARPDTFCVFVGATQLKDSSIVFIGGVFTPIADNNTDDMIVCRMNKNGAITWTSVVGTTREDRAGGIVVDPDSNFVYLAGRTNVSPTADNFQIFVARLNSLNGGIRWSRAYGAPFPASEGAFGIDIDAGRRLYTFGRFHNTGFGHPVAGFGTSDFGLMQLNPHNGDTLATFRIGGNATDECSGFALNATQTRGIMVGPTQSATGRLRIRKGGSSDIAVVAINIPAVSLVLDSTALMLAGAGGKNKCALKSNASWRASYVATWLNVVKMSGFGNDSLKVSAAINTGPQRSANVTLQSGFITRIVTITQKAATSNRTATLQGIYVFPNPSNDFINITFDKTLGSQGGYALFNSIGSCVLKADLVKSQTRIDISKLALGIYKLQIKTAEGSFSQSISIKK